MHSHPWRILQTTSQVLRISELFAVKRLRRRQTVDFLDCRIRKFFQGTLLTPIFSQSSNRREKILLRRTLMLKEFEVVPIKRLKINGKMKMFLNDSDDKILKIERVKRLI